MRLGTAVKMRFRMGGFNLFFGVMVACLLWGGRAGAADVSTRGVVPATGGRAARSEPAQTPEKAADASGEKETKRDESAAKPKKDEKLDKQASTLRFHLETESTGMGTGKVKILRSSPVTLTVDRNAFADEGFIEEARVIDGLGGHMIYVRFNSQGTLRLQMATVTRAGRRVAIHSTWTESRWLAAPLPPRPIEDGVIVFTPDASREECERIVRGVNNVAIKLGNQPKPNKKADNPKKPKKEKEKDRKRKEEDAETEKFLK